MKRPLIFLVIALAFFVFSTFAPFAQAEDLKPFVLGNPPAGDMATVAAWTEKSLADHGFTVVGSYSPFPGAMVICASHPALTAAVAARASENGAFGLAQRVAVAEVEGVIQLSYMNPAYLGAAYGLGPLSEVSAALGAALGSTGTFGSEKGVAEEKLAPGKYHYMAFMPYFQDVWELNTHADHGAAVAAVDANLSAGKGGTSKVYRIDLPGHDVSVFGVGIPVGDGPDSGAKDTDKEILDIIDHKSPRSIAYLPYEIMVTGNRVIALAGKYRIAVHFPDTPMASAHGFTKIMSSPPGIQAALEAVAGK